MYQWSRVCTGNKCFLFTLFACCYSSQCMVSLFCQWSKKLQKNTNQFKCLFIMSYKLLILASLSFISRTLLLVKWMKIFKFSNSFADMASYTIHSPILYSFSQNILVHGKNWKPVRSNTKLNVSKSATLTRIVVFFWVEYLFLQEL